DPRKTARVSGCHYTNLPLGLRHDMRPAYPEEPAHSCSDLKGLNAAIQTGGFRPGEFAARHWRRTAIFGRIT
ncbi:MULTISPECIES: hypothetical protein, partial [unclassified Agrobacterium]|uniref:hypothetical protein n=1 Tax=unclassified Agrobacterium TaxID=2632611 RepID=UPI00244A6B95